MKVDKKHSIAYLNAIRFAVQNYFDLDITSKHRTQDYVYARFVYCKLARELTSLSLQKIGKSINRNHATVIHAVKEIECVFQYDQRVLKSYQYILDRFNKKRSDEQKYYQAMQLAIHYRKKYFDIKN